MNKIITLVEATNGHFYEIKDDFGESIYFPSSTTILDVYPNPALDMWKVTTSKEDIKKAQEEGKIQGSKVHKCIELLIMGDKVLGNGIENEQINKLNLVDKKLIDYLRLPLTEREEEALVGAENFWDEFKPITVSSEMMVYSLKHKYAGTLDWLGYLWNKKKKKYELWIVDWKISKSLSRSYDLQLASYWKALEETYRKKFNVRLGILQLGKNKCNYSFKEVKDKKQSFNIFLKTKEIYDDIYPNSSPKLVSRRVDFILNKYKKKGKIIKLT